MREVFRSVEPSDANNSAYGDQIRSLLILACTEVESAWRAVLLANGGAEPRDRLSTEDYVKLAAPMRLREWRVKLARFPRYPSIAPFRDWTVEKPTQTLPWYDAYNQTKHDRETNLQRATLQHMIYAMCGVHVMLAAQFGWLPLAWPNPVAPDIYFEALPSWRLGELYVPPTEGLKSGPWVAKPFFAAV
jgi:hypothetical protein